MRSATKRVAAGLLVGCVLTAGCERGVDRQYEGGAPANNVEGESVATSDTLPQVKEDDFSINFVLEAQTNPSTGVPIRLPEGLEWSEQLPVDSRVASGDELGVSAVAPSIAASLNASPNSVDKARLAELNGTVGPIIAPIDGTIGASGDTIAILDEGMDAIAQITGMQALRLSSLPIAGTATLETTLGQRSVDCSAVWLSEPSGESAETGYSLHCRIPSYVEVPAFIRATVQVDSEVVEDAKLVPSVAIGVSDTGHFVCLLDDAGAPRLAEVQLGPSDGVTRVVTSELATGAELSIPIGSGCVG